MGNIAEFNRLLQADVQKDADDRGIDLADAFFEHMTARLESVGEIEVAERAYYQGTRGGKTICIDGSGGHPSDSDGVLSIIICDFHQSEDVKSMIASDTKRLFGQLLNFLTYARQDDFRASLASSSPEAGLAKSITQIWPTLSKVKLILITNAIYSARTDAVPAGILNRIPVTYNIWDISRFERHDSSGQAQESLLVDFKKDYGQSVPALAASRDDGVLESYLMVIPGLQLANIYDKWGSRLLQSNVRSFLQAKGKVNKAIRATINDEPDMFFSYNNGLSATAEAVETEQSPEGLRIVSATNLQIVNGGQTTASIHAAKKLSSARLKFLYVQMKLTVVPSSRSEEIVPKISQNANSQNKVSGADFFSNHPFHVLLEKHSRKILAPAMEGSSRESKWFYERTVGQYLVERARFSESDQRSFDIYFPKKQFFEKTELGKVVFSFQGKPEIVSKGKQKNFAEFALDIGAAWTKDQAHFDETWFCRLIAKLIVFRYLEQTIPRQDWYPGAYRANIVTYAIAKLSTDAGILGDVIDFDSVWKSQSVPEPLGNALLKAAEVANEVLLQPSAGIQNIHDWAKKRACWDQLQLQVVNYDLTLQDCLISRTEDREVIRDGRREAAIVSGIEAQSRVVTVGHQFWLHLHKWGQSTNLLSARESGIVGVCAGLAGRLPSERQAIVALQILAQSREKGYRDESEPPRIKIGAWNRVH